MAQEYIQEFGGRLQLAIEIDDWICGPGLVLHDGQHARVIDVQHIDLRHPVRGLQQVRRDRELSGDVLVVGGEYRGGVVGGNRAVGHMVDAAANLLGIDRRHLHLGRGRATARDMELYLAVAGNDQDGIEPVLGSHRDERGARHRLAPAHPGRVVPAGQRAVFFE